MIVRRMDHVGICPLLTLMHRWYLGNVFGTIVGRHAAGFPSELGAYQDVEHRR